jgi:sugar O-acyltransferase (sialic acid O-acetyltransferase NeuD family)
MKLLIILGAGGHAREVAWTAKRSGEYLLVAFYSEPRWTMSGQKIMGVPIISDLEYFTKQCSEEQPVFLVSGVGNRNLSERWMREYERDYKFATIVDPSACVHNIEETGAGTVIMANSIVSIEAVIEKNVLIHYGSIITHNCSLEEGVFIGPGCRLGGNVCIGRYGYLGAGVTVRPNVHIGTGAIIGAGAAVISNIPESSVAYGVPAKCVINEKQIK